MWVRVAHTLEHGRIIQSRTWYNYCLDKMGDLEIAKTLLGWELRLCLEDWECFYRVAFIIIFKSAVFFKVIPVNHAKIVFVQSLSGNLLLEMTWDYISKVHICRHEKAGEDKQCWDFKAENRCKQYFREKNMAISYATLYYKLYAVYFCSI